MQNTKSAKGKIWKIFNPPIDNLLSLSQGLGISEEKARLLLWCGIQTTDQVHSHLYPKLNKTLPSPFYFQDMKQAATRILRAYQMKEKIAIFGDYDVDGATSSALLRRFFQHMQIDHLCYIPDRLKEGYGPSKKAFSLIKKKGCTLILTVDCGTAHSNAYDIDIDVIVLDHHHPNSTLPSVYALVNPNRKDQPNRYSNLAAVGVTFLFIITCCHLFKINKIFLQIQEPPLLEWLDLVALGTICDMVPLTGLNRVFVKQGLKSITQSKNLGIKKLLQISKISGTPKASHIAFQIGPRINAGGRIGESYLGSDILTATNPTEVEHIATLLENYNETRKNLEKECMIHAFNKAHNQKDIICVSSENFHIGIIGIIAGKLKEQFQCPVCVINYTGDIGKGSARSVYNFHIGELILKAVNKKILISGGGHDMAAGFTLKRSQENNFISLLKNDYLKCQRSTPKLDITLEMTISSINMDLMKFLDQLEPFGINAPRPRFVFRDAFITDYSILKNKHFKLTIKQSTKTITALLFDATETVLGEILKNAFHYKKKIHLAGALHMNQWMQQTSIQFFIEDAMLEDSMIVD